MWWKPLLALCIVALFFAPNSVRADELSGPPVQSGPGIATLSVEAGQIQGVLDRGINTFKGVPYAQAERFMPPVPVEPWGGTRTALAYGAICPQPVSSPPDDIVTFLSDDSWWPQSENCQNLNIWSPGLDNSKRPVMVWLHGGGYETGSSHQLNVYDGHNLSARHDIVVVSVNHRLNVLGFLDLSAYGDELQSSGNAGMLDLVAALQWIQSNIARFGGDPHNVTIFGQSGGGAKVSVLMTAPSAQGLFHKAIIMSGMARELREPPGGQSVTQRVAELTFVNAGLEPGDLEGLRSLPYGTLIQAADKARVDTASEIGMGGMLGRSPTISWAPVTDGRFLLGQPFQSIAPSVSSEIPLIIGSTAQEFAVLNPMVADRQTWSLERLARYLSAVYGDRAAEILNAAQRAYPNAPPGQLAAIDVMFRPGTISAARLKSKQGTAPVYVYLFDWQSTGLGGWLGAGHGVDVPFAFDNLDRGANLTGGTTEETRLLAEQISGAWVSFARTGDPNHFAMPHWPTFSNENPSTMIFGQLSRVRHGHDFDLMALISPEAEGPKSTSAGFAPALPQE